MNNIKLNSRLIHYLMLGLIALLVIIGLAGADLIDGQLSKQATQLVALKAKSQALTTEQHNLIQAKQEIAKYGSLEKIAQTIVPQTKDQAEAVREINAFAQQNNINLSGIIFPDSSLGSAAGATPATPAAAPAAGAPAVAVPLSQLTPVPGIPGVYNLTINVEDTLSTDAVTYPQFYGLLKDIEQNRLTSQVTGINIQPTSSLINFTITINEYIKPQP